jgi:hypothetical protein
MRRGLPVLAAVGAVLLLAGPAAAVGTNGVQMHPELAQARDGRVVLEAGGAPSEGRIRLENRADTPRTVEVYAVAASPTAAGGADLEPRGSAPWFGLEPRTVELAAGERRELVFTAAPERAPPSADDLHVAVVLEAGGGSTVVTQAVSLIRVAAPAARPVVLWPWVLLAAALLLGVVAGQAAAVRDRWRRRLGASAAPAIAAG